MDETKPLKFKGITSERGKNNHEKILDVFGMNMRTKTAKIFIFV